MLQTLLYTYVMKTLQLHNLSPVKTFYKCEKNNDTFKVEIEVSFKTEVVEQLRLNNIAITKSFNQKFEALQTVILQTVKDLVLKMIPIIP